MINANTPYCPPHPGDSPLYGRAEPAQVANVKRAVPSSHVGRRAASNSYRYASDKQCPLCGGRLIRTPRRLQDRLLSMAEPLMRFRCDRFSCQWVGNIKGRNAGQREDHPDRSWLKPGAVVLATLLGSVGVIVLSLYIATDLFDSVSLPIAGAPTAEWKDLTQRLNTGSAASLAPAASEQGR